MVIPEKVEFFKSYGMVYLEAKDVSNAVLYVLGTPPHVQVSI